MDSLDMAIIDALRADGRVANSKIASFLGVSEGTIRRRLKIMIDGGMLKIGVISNPTERQKTSMCMVGVTVDPAMVDTALERLCEREEVTFAASTAGGYDLMACVNVETSEKLGEFLMTVLGAIPGVIRTETYMLTSVGKDAARQFGG